jgi:hypothetical protein
LQLTSREIITCASRPRVVFIVVRFGREAECYVGLLDLEGLSEAELEHLKGSFTKLAGYAPDTAILREAAEDLDSAGAEIQEAKEKVTAVAALKARKPLR